LDRKRQRLRRKTKKIRELTEEGALGAGRSNLSLSSTGTRDWGGKKRSNSWNWKAADDGWPRRRTGFCRDKTGDFGKEKKKAISHLTLLPSPSVQASDSRMVNGDLDWKAAAARKRRFCDGKTGEVWGLWLNKELATRGMCVRVGSSALALSSCGKH